MPSRKSSLSVSNEEKTADYWNKFRYSEIEAILGMALLHMREANVDGKLRCRELSNAITRAEEAHMWVCAMKQEPLPEDQKPGTWMQKKPGS
jgi:hypothetical protein